MEPVTQLPAAASTGAPVWLGRCWAVVLLGLVAWQGWMTYTLFGADPTWRVFVDERPILSGVHPLHLYHGFLGAQSLRERGTLSCYDPAFQAGYPKTPVFDSGSRPAELFLSLAGGECKPGAYKIGLAVCCVLAPLVLAGAARGAGLGGGAACVATLLGLLVWWGKPGRQLLEAGDLDLLLGGLAALAQTGLLLRFHRQPSPAAWVGLFLVTALGWFAHPLLFATLLPLFLLFYLTVGASHRLGWHFALLASGLCGVGTNAFWLVDWVAHCWIYLPLQTGGALLSHRTFHTFWAAPLWGEASDRVLALAILVAAFVGAVIWNETRQRAPARLLGLGAAGLVALALGGISWEPLSRLGTPRLLVPALWFALLPAAHALAEANRWMGRLMGSTAWGPVFALVLVLAAGLGTWPAALPLVNRCTGTPPLVIGLDEQQEDLIATLVTQTTPEARILWEDGTGWPRTSRWTALLPLWTARSFLGGLDPDAAIEHSHAHFANQVLAGRPLADWTDEELADFCQRYNIGWVACWSPAALNRFHDWSGAEAVAALPGETSGCLFQLRPRSFVLKGQARLVRADSQRITLADVVPEDGRVVLSLHYQAGLRVSPGRVQIEREPDPHDPIPFIRLLMPGPVARLTLTWYGD